VAGKKIEEGKIGILSLEDIEFPDVQGYFVLQIREPSGEIRLVI
jgi:hypothetical protein